MGELEKDNEDETDMGGDIWSSINETLDTLKESTNKKQITKSGKSESSSITKDKHQDLEDCKDSLLDDLNSSNNSELDGWPFDGDNLKDEKTVKPETTTTLRDKKESKSSQELTAARKSRQKRKDSEENLGNPDSGKENADVENLEMGKSDSKKSERVLSPVTKRRKIAN